MNGKLTSRRASAAIVFMIAAGLLGGHNPARAAEPRTDELDKVIPPAMERASIPGVIIGVWQDGHEPYVKAFGVSDTATKQPMTTDLYFYIGSNTKSFTVTSILMLADKGKLGLDDPI